MIPTAAGCFLCQPNPELVYFESPTAIALCGLGPLVDGYSVVATKEHMPSSSDAMTTIGNSFAQTVVWVREELVRLYGSCLLAEHGRMPVCANELSANRHCYHAHFLLFPDGPEVEDAAVSYFAEVEVAPSLELALKLAHDAEEYFLFSPKRDRFLIMRRPADIVHQFSRLLVAIKIGMPERADWRRFPDEDRTVDNAAFLREAIKPDCDSSN